MSKQRIEKNVQIITIDKTEAFKYKTTFFAGKDAKTGHKNASNTADKHPHTPAKASRRPGSAPLPHPGLCGGYTLKRLCKLFLTKEKPVLMKKEAALTGFAPVPGRSLFLSYN
ncbi:MAG: hypothetical protein MSD59_06305 [Parabacteroides merdae]|nr:hypothetical protein [Parabacteroides merdae]